MAGGGQGGGGMGGGQGGGGMGGGAQPGAGGDLGPAMGTAAYFGGEFGGGQGGGGMGGGMGGGAQPGAGVDLGTAGGLQGGFDANGNLFGSSGNSRRVSDGMGGGYGGMGGFGGGYGMGSPFGGFGMGMPGMGYGGGMGGFGMGMGSPFGGFGGMPMYGGYGGGMGGYGGFGGMGGYGGGMGGFSRGMGSPFRGGMGGMGGMRGGMGGIQDRMYREQPGMAYEGGSPGFYSNPQTRSDTGFDFHPVDFEQHVMGGIQDRMYRGQPGRDMPVQEGGRSPLAFLPGGGIQDRRYREQPGGMPGVGSAFGGAMTQIQGGSSRGNLDQFNLEQALRSGFLGRAAVEPPQPHQFPPASAAVLPQQPAPDALTGGPAEVINKGMTKPYIEPAAPAAPQIPSIQEKEAKLNDQLRYSKPGSADEAYNQELAMYNSPQYAAYYNSLPPSTRAFMNKPGDPARGRYLAEQARSNYQAFGPGGGFKAGGIASLLKRK